MFKRFGSLWPNYVTSQIFVDDKSGVGTVDGFVVWGVSVLVVLVVVVVFGAVVVAVIFGADVVVVVFWCSCYCCCCCCCCSWWWCWLFLWGRAQGTVTASLNLFTSCRIEDCKEFLASWGSWLWLWWWGLQAGLMIAKNKMATKYEIQNTKYNLPVYGDAGCGFLCQVEQRFLVNCSPSDGNDGQWWWWWW